MPSQLQSTVKAALTIIIIAALSVTVLGWMQGWRVHAMTTPSMGTAAPVGTLVISQPVPASSIRPGDLIVFHPPGRPGTTYAHRVHAVQASAEGPLIRTKGDINDSVDAWTVTSADIVGRSVLTIPAGGFVLQAMPWMLCGTFVILLATTGFRKERRQSARLLLGSVLVSLLLFKFHPLERIVLIKQTIEGGHGVVTVVPTGILPLRATITGGSSVDMVSGQPGTLQLHGIPPGGGFGIHTSVHLSGWWWLALIGWGLPMLVGLLSILRRKLFERHPTPAPIPAAA